VIITANHRALSAIFIALSNLTGIERQRLPGRNVGLLIKIVE
jgi:hypothetical protein